MQYGIEAFLSETLSEVTTTNERSSTMNQSESQKNSYSWSPLCDESPCPSVARIKQEAPDTTTISSTTLLDLGFRSPYSSQNGLPDDMFSNTGYLASVPQIGIPSPSGSTCSSVGGESPLMYETNFHPTSRSDSGYIMSSGAFSSGGGVIKQEPGHTNSCAFTNSTSGMNKILGNIKTEDPISSSTCQLPLEQFEQVQTWAREQAARDIYQACELLGITADPSKWSQDQVRTWFTWVLQQHQLPGGYADLFRMDGSSLCRLTETDFKQRAPHCGDILYALLDIWKNSALDDAAKQQFNSPAFRPDETFVDFRRYSRWQSSGNSPCASPPTGTTMPVTRFPSSFESAGLTGSGSGLAEALALPVTLPNSTTDTSQAGCVSIAGSDVASDSLPSDDEGGDEVEVERRPGSQSHIHLWQFLKELLAQPQMYGSCIRWLDRPKGIFKIEDSVRVARLWGKRKNRPAMNYDKLSRSIRQYYKKGIMKKTERSQRLVYQFCHPYSL